MQGRRARRYLSWRDTLLRAARAHTRPLVAALGYNASLEKVFVAVVRFSLGLLVFIFVIVFFFFVVVFFVAVVVVVVVAAAAAVVVVVVVLVEGRYTRGTVIKARARRLKRLKRRRRV